MINKGCSLMVPVRYIYGFPQLPIEDILLNFTGFKVLISKKEPEYHFM